MANVQERKNKKGEVISYSVRVHRGIDKNGKQLKPYSTTWKVPKGMSARKIQSELNKFVVSFEKECREGIIADNKQTFEKYADYVIQQKERAGTKHKTIILYKRLLKRINPEIGHLKIADIRPQHLNCFYEKLSRNGENKITGGKLSNKTILEHHRLIETILAQADKELLIPYNAASKATPPKIRHKDANYFEIEDINNILCCLQQEPLKWQLAISLMIYTGCRRGELLGLKWEKINFKDNKITIDTNLLYSPEKGIYTDTLKTEESNRKISIPQEVMELLKSYKREYNLYRLKMGSAFNDTGFIFIQENGNPMHPDSITTYCKRFSERYNKIIEKENKESGQNRKLLPHINPHAFRHTQASLLLFNNVDSVTVSKRLGHSKVSTTTDIYSHVLEKADNEASAVLSDILPLKKVQ